jgi:hypothetical protein
VETEPRTVSWVSVRLRSAEADPHIIERIPGLERCGAPLPKQECPYPLARRSSWCPSVAPVSRFQGQAPSGGAANFEALLH